MRDHHYDMYELVFRRVFRYTLEYDWGILG